MMVDNLARTIKYPSAEFQKRMVTLLSPIRQFIELTPSVYKLVKKCCGGDRLIDILFHLPVGLHKRVDDELGFADGDTLTVVMTVMDHKEYRSFHGPYKIIGVTAIGQKIAVMYFNYKAGYLRKAFVIGQSYTVSGRAKHDMGGYITIVHPDIIGKPQMAKYYVGYEPVYPLTSYLSAKALRYVLAMMLKVLPDGLEWIPEHIKQKYDLVDFDEAIKNVHKPQKPEDLLLSNKYRERLALDEVLANQIRLKQIKRNQQEKNGISIKSTGELLNKLKLPFELTKDQIKCFEDIEADLASGRLMNRLIQGDVGSGKTITALLGALIAVENKMQAVFLAPTEILAWQHFETFQKLTESLDLEIDVMLSSNRRARKRQLKELKDGTTQILIGTHAILEDNVEFKNLGFIVIDEQHKFGVMQRMKLIDKSVQPNILSMSATPIPRTLLLGCYGNIDVSTIKTKPKGRKEVKTIVIQDKGLDDLVKRLNYIDSQVFWVCPVIEESTDFVDVNTRCAYLKQAFSDREVEVIHGKMKPAEKDAIMERFKDKKFKVLVATTVIEVGVDIPNANVMVIEHAERFGLAQLHQLRGRVGRGTQKAYCVLYYHYPISNVGKRRLKLMQETTDGFILSEEDLKLRGAGDILGKEQSGFDVLRFSDFTENLPLIEIAEEIVEEMDLDSPVTQGLCDIFNRVSDKNIV